jgi:hypothetical protein
LFLCLLLVTILAGLAACSKPQATELPFETIDRYQGPGHEIGQSEMDEPGLLIFTSAEDVAQKGH